MRKVIAVTGAATGASAAGTAALLGIAALLPAPAVFLGAGALAALGVWLAAGRAIDPRSRVLPGAGAVVVGLVLMSVLVPLGDPARPPAMPPGAGVWTLPDGARLAYGKVPAAPGTSSAIPVVVLHGGPGVPDLAGHLTALGELAADGHDVWAYEQRGTGRSTRLADPRGYTADRAVRDLEEVRRLIGAPRLILIGHSYGAFLAAAYVAAYPGRVERVVFSSPGDLDLAGVGGTPQTRLDGGQQRRLYALLLHPRALLAYALVQVNPAAAHAFAGDRELDARQDRVHAATAPAIHCPGRPHPQLHALGFYANQVPQSLRRPPVPDVRGALRGTAVPALILKGQCDYLSWESALGYVDVFGRSVLAYLPGAGHDAYVDRPDSYLAAVRAFLRGMPVPGRRADPRPTPEDYQP